MEQQERGMRLLNEIWIVEGVKMGWHGKNTYYHCISLRWIRKIIEYLWAFGNKGENYTFHVFKTGGVNQKCGGWEFLKCVVADAQ